MGKDSGIEWCHHTFNPWIGCAKVSPACANCYAEVETFTRVQREKGIELWGKDAARHRTGPTNWKQPIAWDRAAKAAAVPARVFCASLADVFEDRRDLDAWRADLWSLIERTPSLIWMLLTKRADARRIQDLAKQEWRIFGWPKNVWLGTTAENQEMLDERAPEILNVPAAVHFISAEPLLGAMRVNAYQAGTCMTCAGGGEVGGAYHSDDGLQQCDDCNGTGVDDANPGLDLVICGGESGRCPRPMHPDWVRSLRDECVTMQIAFHFKQWGEWAPTGPLGALKKVLTIDGRAIDKTVDVVCAADRERPVRGPVIVYRVGKKIAGRLLDGRTWDQMPKVEE